jgi:probable selenium-dependent hydroxylase accessory protein YqeC
VESPRDAGGQGGGVSPSWADRLGVGAGAYVFLIGGGGKTSLMFALAHELAGRGLRVLTTTSTRIRRPREAECPALVVSDDVGEVILRLREGGERHVTAGRATIGEGAGKLAGFSAAELDAIREAGVADVVLVEADGSAGRPIKAHLDHEPVLSQRASLVVSVIGLSGVGVPATERHVHRLEAWCERAGRSQGDIIRPEDVARAFFHAEGHLRRVPRTARFSVFLGQAGAEGAERHAEPLRSALLGLDLDARLDRVVVGELLA